MSNVNEHWMATDKPLKPASRLQILKAKLFGKRVISEDSGYKIIGYARKGTLYITKMSKSCHV